MASFDVNKGVGKSIEFKGLRAMYVIYLALGLLIGVLLSFFSSFSSFLFGYMAAIIVAIVYFPILFALCFYLNKRFGQYGIKHYLAYQSTPKRLYFTQRIGNSVQKQQSPC